MDTSPSIFELIKAKNHTDLLHLAAQIHGHYCPGLAKGVMASVYAINHLDKQSDGMEDMLAIVETNNCFSDGVQFVTACTFGNNSLIYKDFGKTAFTLTLRNGHGIRMYASTKSKHLSRQTFSHYHQLHQKVIVEQNRDEELLIAYKQAAYERSLTYLTFPINDLFDISEAHVQIPQYAKIVDSVDCTACGESTMKNRTIENAKGDLVCLHCAKTDYAMLDGNGIHLINNKHE
jgi:formylmethanofuran dehydrogenase subunit E